jgi:hypothetical protein
VIGKKLLANESSKSARLTDGCTCMVDGISSFNVVNSAFICSVTDAITATGYIVCAQVGGML